MTSSYTSNISTDTDVDVKKNLMTPEKPPDITLHDAARLGYKKKVKSLLEFGGHPDQPGRFGRLPLHLAARFNRVSILKILLDHGSNIEAKTDNSAQRNALHYAASRGHITCVDFILGAGANIDSTDSKNKTALYIAASAGHTKVVASLIESKANLEIADSQKGWTPLHVAIEKSRLKSVYLLLLAGADPNVKCKKGFTPAEHAKRQKNHKIMGLFNSDLNNVKEALTNREDFAEQSSEDDQVIPTPKSTDKVKP